MINSALSDLVVRIKNAAATPNRRVVELPITKLVSEVVDVLAELGFVEGVKTFKVSGLPYNSLHLKPSSKLSGIRCVSKPGRRIYCGFRELRPILGGIGSAVLSTPQGVISDKQAKKQRVGGEVLLEVW